MEHNHRLKPLMCSATRAIGRLVVIIFLHLSLRMMSPYCGLELEVTIIPAIAKHLLLLLIGRPVENQVSSGGGISSRRGYTLISVSTIRRVAMVLVKSSYSLWARETKPADDGVMSVPHGHRHFTFQEVYQFSVPELLHLSDNWAGRPKIPSWLVTSLRWLPILFTLLEIDGEPFLMAVHIALRLWAALNNTLSTFAVRNRSSIRIPQIYVLPRPAHIKLRHCYKSTRSHQDEGGDREGNGAVHGRSATPSAKGSSVTWLLSTLMYWAESPGETDDDAIVIAQSQSSVTGRQSWRPARFATLRQGWFRSRTACFRR